MIQNGEEEHWEGVTNKLMSDEESGHEQGTLIVRSLQWRADDLTEVVRVLDGRLETENQHKKRKLGEPSDRQPSALVPHKFLKETDDEEEEEEDDEFLLDNTN